MKIKCFKALCPVCKASGSIQLFFNNSLELRYARTRHYSHLDKDSKKPQFTYCKLEDIGALKTLLLNKGISLNTDKADSGQLGQTLKANIRDHELKELSFKWHNGWAGSSARIEHHPPKPSSDHNIDFMKYRELLLSKYCRSYALQIFNNSIKYQSFLDNPHGISALPTSIRGNVLKAMVNLAKFLGVYDDYKLKLKNHGVKWVNSDDSFNSFLRIINNSHSNLGEWYKDAIAILPANEKLYLKFTLLSGLRKSEAINAMMLIQQLSNNGKLCEYYNEELGILEHFRYGDLYLRHSKNVYISIVAKDLIQQISNSQPVYYTTIRKHLQKNKLPLRVKELRSYFATYLRKHGIVSEYIDLLQGRIPKSVFARHYLKVDDFKALVAQVLAVTENLERDLLS